MKDKKGQALIEFVLILPILIMLLFSIIDFSNIMIIKNDLESKINDASIIIKNSEDLSNIYETVSNSIKKTDSKINVSIEVNIDDDAENYIQIKLSKNLKTITPGLNLILGNPYNINVERTIIYEK